MAKLRFHPEVLEDIRNTKDWYDRQADGLGTDFVNELEAVFQRIQRNPRQFPQFSGPIHRGILPRFPFAVLFIPSSAGSLVLAVMHQHRRPGFWRDCVPPG